MAVFGNFKGTTYPYFSVSKTGVKIHGSTLPNDPQHGDMWLDHLSATVRVFDSGSASWRNVGSEIRAGSTEPTNPNVNDIWYDDTNQALKIRSTESWIDITGNLSAQGHTHSVTDIQDWQTLTGYTGSQGTQGAVGFTGSQGTQGAVGFTGSAGADGAQGAVGFTGSQGTQGAVGFTGSAGADGAQGAVGFTGSQGPVGFVGSSGNLTATLDQVVENGGTTLRSISVGDLSVAGNITLTGCIQDSTANISGVTYALSPNNGGIQVHDITDDTTYTISSSFENGMSFTMMISLSENDVITWPAELTWVGSATPTLETGGYNVLEFWKVNNTVYGTFVGAT